MRKVQTFRHCVVGVTSDRGPVLIDAPRPLYSLMDSPIFEEHCQPDGFASMPTSPGLYLATIECRRVPGVPGRVDCVATEVRRTTIEGLAADRYHRFEESSGVARRLAGGLSSALGSLLALVQHHPRSPRLPRPHPRRHRPTVWPYLRGVGRWLISPELVIQMILMLTFGFGFVLGQLTKVGT
jgi:hypothetical protein